MGSLELTYPRRFRLGDRVRIRDGRSDGAPWTVIGDDTEHTPVHDTQPAYKLARVGARRDSHHNVRYCYESALEPAGATTPVA